jgi:hypothetical protein
MARDNHPRVRQAYKLTRKQGKIAPADRVLIVSEGSKTEPFYFEEIRKALRLPTANIRVTPSDYGTCPLQVVKFAKDLFSSGNKNLNIRPKVFEKVYAVFDRDDHEKYHEALTLSQSYNEKKLRNDQNRVIEFKAIPSVPNFELWFLLHFEDCRAAMHRTEVVDKLKVHLPEYEKGQGAHYQSTKKFIPRAKDNAIFLAKNNSSWDGNELYTDIHVLVEKLTGLKPR